MKLDLYIPFVSHSSYSTVKSRTRLNDPMASSLRPDGRDELVALERKRAKQALRHIEEDIKQETLEREKEIKKTADKVIELNSEFSFGKPSKLEKSKMAKGKKAVPKDEEEPEEKTDKSEDSDEPESETDSEDSGDDSEDESADGDKEDADDDPEAEF